MVRSLWPWKNSRISHPQSFYNANQTLIKIIPMPLSHKERSFSSKSLQFEQFSASFHPSVKIILGVSVMTCHFQASKLLHSITSLQSTTMSFWLCILYSFSTFFVLLDSFCGNIDPSLRAFIGTIAYLVSPPEMSTLPPKEGNCDTSVLHVVKLCSWQ